jgi:hypothetical protein
MGTEPAARAGERGGTRHWFRSAFRRRRVKANGPAVLLWAVCLYALAQAALFSASGRWTSIGPLTESRKWPRLRGLAAAQPGPPLGVMFGSSRVCWAFQAGRLDGLHDTDGRPLQFYNFGIPATGPIHALLYLRDMLAEGIRPKLVLVEYLPALLSEPHGTWASEEYFASMPWTSWRDLTRLNPYFSRHSHQKLKEWLVARVAAWYTFRTQINDEARRVLLGEIIKPPPQIDARGACILNEPPTAESRQSDTAYSLKLYGPPLEHYRVGHGPSRALREFLELCRGQGIRVVMVIMPESSAFRRLYTPKTREIAGDLLNGLVRHYGLDVIDANDWLPDEDFEDGHHVVASGAEHFSVRLRGELQRVLDRPAAGLLEPSPRPVPAQAGRQRRTPAHTLHANAPAP